MQKTRDGSRSRSRAPRPRGQGSRSDLSRQYQRLARKVTGEGYYDDSSDTDGGDRGSGPPVWFVKALKEEGGDEEGEEDVGADAQEADADVAKDDAETPEVRGREAGASDATPVQTAHSEVEVAVPCPEPAFKLEEWLREAQSPESVVKKAEAVEKAETKTEERAEKKVEIKAAERAEERVAEKSARARRPRPQPLWEEKAPTPWLRQPEEDGDRGLRPRTPGGGRPPGDMVRTPTLAPTDGARTPLASPMLPSPRLASPRLASPMLPSPRVASPMLPSPRIASPRLPSPRVASPRLASPMRPPPLMPPSPLAPSPVASPMPSPLSLKGKSRAGRREAVYTPRGASPSPALGDAPWTALGGSDKGQREKSEQGRPSVSASSDRLDELLEKLEEIGFP